MLGCRQIITNFLLWILILEVPQLLKKEETQTPKIVPNELINVLFIGEVEEHEYENRKRVQVNVLKAHDTPGIKADSPIVPGSGSGNTEDDPKPEDDDIPF